MSFRMINSYTLTLFCLAMKIFSWQKSIFVLNLLLFVHILFVIPSGSALASIRSHKNYKTDTLTHFSDEVHNYLTEFGYLPKSDIETGNLRTEEQLKGAIKSLQRFGNVPETGVIDDKTRELIRKPRCGVPDQPDAPDFSPDNLGSLSSRRSKRFVIQGAKWHNTDLTWSLVNQTMSTLDAGQVRRILTEALGVWSRNSKLSFREVYSAEADIQVLFARRHHGDGYDFDGPGQVLAHAFYPGTGRGGDAHFDEEENWFLNGTHSNLGTNLLGVAVHEFGHSLGLGHSSVEDAIMFPWYHGYRLNGELPEDDRLAIQQIYGSKEKQWGPYRPQQRPQTPPTTTTTTTTTKRPSIRFYPDRPQEPNPRERDPKEKPNESPYSPWWDKTDPRHPHNGHRHHQHDPRYPPNDPRYNQPNDPRYPSYDPEYPQKDPRYNYNNPRYPQENDPRYPQPRPGNEDPREPPTLPREPENNNPRHRPHYRSEQQPPTKDPRKPFSNPHYPHTHHPRTPAHTTEAPGRREPTTQDTPTHRPRRKQHSPHYGTTSEKPKNFQPDTCNTNYDAIAVIRGEIFIFKDKYLWRIGKQGLYAGYPHEITRLWGQLPDNFTKVDAVYENKERKIVFFIGHHYYVFDSNVLEAGYPKPLKHLGLPHFLRKIDAVLIWGYNNRTYFYSDTLYWRLDDDLGTVELDYPRDMSIWRGIGYHIDTAFQYLNGKTYFFKGKGFWEFDDSRMSVAHERPKASAQRWMRCLRSNEVDDPPSRRKEPLTSEGNGSGFSSSDSVHQAKYYVNFLAIIIITMLPYNRFSNFN